MLLNRSSAFAALVMGVMLQPIAAWAEDEAPEWFGPAAGDLELRIGADFAHAFASQMTGFDLETGLGYYFNDWLEGSLTGVVGYRDDEVAVTAGRIRLGVREQALSSATPRALVDGWFGGFDIGLRFFPLATSDTLIAPSFAPFLNFDMGLRAGRGIGATLRLGPSIGFNIHITEQVAITPEFGYAALFATDEERRFSGTNIEHALAMTWTISFFVTP